MCWQKEISQDWDKIEVCSYFFQTHDIKDNEGIFNGLYIVKCGYFSYHNDSTNDHNNIFIILKKFLNHNLKYNIE